MREFRFGFATVVGKPNVGKSSFINRLTGAKVSITSRRPQTTRNRIIGVLNTPTFQLAMTDTPGIHKSGTVINQRIDSIARSSISGADISVMLIDARGWKSEDELVWNAVTKHKQPIFILINKIDLLVHPTRLLPLIRRCSVMGEIEEIIPISVKTGHNLDLFVELVEARLPFGPPGFPLETPIVSELEFSIAELIREQVFRLAGAEIPYRSAVMVERGSVESGSMPEFHAEIWVETVGQKAILIGPRGRRLKDIGTRVRKQVETMVGRQVVLTTRVSVQKKWSSDPSKLRSLGYGK